VRDPDTQSYDIEPAKSAPDLPGSVRMGEDIEETLDLLAADLFVQSTSCVNQFGDFHLALSHGQLQERLLIKLMIDPKYRSMPWTRTHLWSIDESIVEPGHPEHSMTHWSQIVHEAGGIPSQQLHPINAHLPTAATDYHQELIEHLEWRERGHDRLDFVLIGDERALIRGFDDPADQLVGFAPCQSRIVMTRRLLNASRFIGIVSTGDAGRSLVDDLTQSSTNPLDSAQIGLCPQGGVLRWYLDDYACRHTHDPHINEEPINEERPEPR